MIYEYRTKFKLTKSIPREIRDFCDIFDLLCEENMVNYLFHGEEERKLNGTVYSIRYRFEEDDHGYIEVGADRELSEDELFTLSCFISAQNSGAMGEKLFEKCGVSFDYENDEYKFEIY